MSKLKNKHIEDDTQWYLDKDDLLKKRLRLQISMWYDHWYMGDDLKKQVHLMKFDSHFDIMRFDELEDEELKEEEIKFLQELQEIVDNENIDV